jgi:hypothetical protein
MHPLPSTDPRPVERLYRTLEACAAGRQRFAKTTNILS